MSVDIGDQARSIIQRLGAIDRASPVIDRARVEAALAEHGRALGVALPPVRWVADAEAGCFYVYRPAESVAISAAESAAWSAWSAAWGPAESAAARGTSISFPTTPRGRRASVARSAAWRAAKSAAWGPAESAAISVAISVAELPRAGWALRSTAWSAWSAAWGPAESTAESAARSAWSAAEYVAESAAWKNAATIEAVNRWIGIRRPFVDAAEAGLWLFSVTRDAVVAVPRPALQIVDDRLHCADGPAVAWPNGARYYFWRGVQVPDRVILRPLDLRVDEIRDERNAEVRRVMLERYGAERYLLDIGAQAVHRDETGELYRAELTADEPLVMVRVLNGTPEPDGSRKPYFLRVPPTMQRAREAVAWTFGLREDQYRPTAES